MATCVGCEQRIVDQYLLRVDPDMEWHASCLRCNDCRQYLDEFCTCFIRDGKTYCKQDYIRLFSSRCSRCEKSFRKDDLVMKIDQLIFHLNCFTCDICSRQLMSGDKYAILKDDHRRRILCEVDYELAAVAAASATADYDRVTVGIRQMDDQEDGADTSNTSTQSSDNFINISHLDDAALKRSSAETGGRSSLLEARGLIRRSVGCGGGVQKSPRSSSAVTSAVTRQSSKSADQKTTRVRTVLNEKQLHMLRTCYGANPRPDALMKEQLVEMTGLSSRVIRVWFQNKRCKDKKRVMLMKQIHQHHQDTAAVSMVAASPVRHDPPISMMPVAVQQYQVPWSNLMSSDSMHAGPSSSSSYGPLQSTAPLQLHKTSAASVAVSASSILMKAEEAPPSKCHPSSSRVLGADPMPAPAATTAAAAAAAFQKLLLTFGDLSDEEDDSVVSVDEPCSRRTTTGQTFNGCGPSPLTLRRNCRQQPSCMHPYILSTLNKIR